VLRAEGRARNTVIFQLLSSFRAPTLAARACVDGRMAGQPVRDGEVFPLTRVSCGKAVPLIPRGPAAGGDPTHRFFDSPSAPGPPRTSRTALPYTVRALAELIDRPADETGPRSPPGNARGAYGLAVEG